MSRSMSSLSIRHSDVASVTASLNYSNLYSPPHNLYSHLYSQSSSSSTSSTAVSSLHPTRTHPSLSFLPAFTTSIHTSPESTSHDLSAPPSPSSSSRSHTRTLGFGVGAGLATATLMPAYRTLQPLEAFPAPVRAPLSLPPSLPRPTLPPQLAYPPSFMQVTEDKEEARTPTDELDEHDPELASLSSSSSFSLSRVQPSTPTLSRFQTARSASIGGEPTPVARDDFVHVELDPREPLPVWHPSMRTSLSI